MKTVVRVRLELDLVDGVHFNPRSRSLDNNELRTEATKSFLAWLDSFFTDDKQDAHEIEEYIQSFVLEN